MGVSLRWLLGFIATEYEQLPDDLNYQANTETDKLLIWSLEGAIKYFICHYNLDKALRV